MRPSPSPLPPFSLGALQAIGTASNNNNKKKLCNFYSTGRKGTDGEGSPKALLGSGVIAGDALGKGQGCMGSAARAGHKAWRW